MVAGLAVAVAGLAVVVDAVAQQSAAVPKSAAKQLLLARWRLVVDYIDCRSAASAYAASASVACVSADWADRLAVRANEVRARVGYASEGHASADHANADRAREDYVCGMANANGLHPAAR